MNAKREQQIRAYLDEAAKIESGSQINPWRLRVSEFLRHVSGITAVAEFGSLDSGSEFSGLARQMGYLEGILATGEEPGSQSSGASATKSVNRDGSSGKSSGRDVFVVHGHDSEVKETVARFLEKLGLVPIILHEQPNEGRTIIEKFEVASGEVTFAVVLLTPDDLGGADADRKHLKLRPRGRQNVILELGYFMGRLGRSHVCAMYRGDLELPTDFQGVIYIPFDAEGVWRTKLTQELVSAKMPVNVEALFQKQ